MFRGIFRTAVFAAGVALLRKLTRSPRTRRSRVWR